MTIAPLPSPTALVSTVHPRPYQEDAVAAIQTAFERGVRRQLVALPTGTGKTVVFAEVIRRRSGRALVLAHRDELIRQAVSKIEAVAPGLQVGVVKADEDDVEADVVVASVQTLQRTHRRERLGRVFQTIIVDEAHHAAAPSYRGILTYFWSFDDEQILTLGVTATPERGDRQRLDCFEEIVYNRDLTSMIREGYLVDLRAAQVGIAANLDRVSVHHGDFAAEALGKAMHDASASEMVVQAYEKFASGRRALVFTPTVALAHETAEAFVMAGLSAAALDGTTALDERRSILEQLGSGELAALANCAVLTEGFDEPSINTVIIARPTKSRQLYLQMVGRGTRLYPGKDDCLILDLVGVSQLHKLVSAASRFGLPKGAFGQGLHTLGGILGAQGAEAAATGDLVAVDVDLFRRSELRWQVLETGAASLNVDGGVILVRPAGERWTATLIPYRRDANPEVLAETPDRGYAYGAAEDYVRFHRLERLTSKNATWRGQSATEGQLAQLTRLGIRVDNGATRGQASDLIAGAQANRHLARATPAQIWRLRKSGVPTPEGLTKREASALIDELVRQST